MGSRVMKLLAVVAVALVLLAPAVKAAVTCSQVYGQLGPCMSVVLYGTQPSPDCCGGVKNILDVAQTTADRRSVCGCLKNAAQGISSSAIAAAAAIPRLCHIAMPYQIDPNVNCDRIH
ncbi:non-specific lipid-transfer protein 1-like [Wolffia australiana]